MPFTLNYIVEKDYIEATFTGPLTLAVSKEYLAELIPLLEQTGCKRLLSDSTEAQLLLSSGDVLQFPRLADASPLTAHLKRAVLAAPGKSGYEMDETLSTIMGQNGT